MFLHFPISEGCSQVANDTDDAPLHEIKFVLNYKDPYEPTQFSRDENIMKLWRYFYKMLLFHTILNTSLVYHILEINNP